MISKIKLLLFAIIGFSTFSFAQQPFETLKDTDGSPILKGLITTEHLSQDTNYKWYAENVKKYSATDDLVSKFAAYKDSIHLFVFMGTWCSDSHYLMPKLFSFLDAAGFAKDRMTLVGVDRQKKTLNHMSEVFGVTLVPTVIILKEGKEIGRIVEYGSSGLLEKDLTDIVTKELTKN